MSRASITASAQDGMPKGVKSRLKDRLIVALDVDTLEEAIPLVETLAPYVGCFKVGLELLTSVGAPGVVDAIRGLGGEIFFDGKFNDIPNTVGRAAGAASRLGVKMFDVHASSGEASVRAAAEKKGRSLLLVVTVLTSMDELECQRLFGSGPAAKVPLFAELAARCGADGIVCSPRELPFLETTAPSRDLLRVTPGIRPRWAEVNDQKRMLTPTEAIRAGATHLVVGRPILHPPPSIGSVVEAAKRVLDEIAGAMEENGGGRDELG